MMISGIPTFSNRRQEQYARYNQSPKGRARTVKKEREYREARPFIAWDGEGVTLDDGSHIYTSLASSVGHYIEDPEGLSSDQIFDLLLEAKREHGKSAIHVIYGGGYDANMWLSDIPLELVEILYRKGRVLWGSYQLEWRQGKYFRVRSRRDRTTITINDVVSFFQCAFVKACDDYLGNDWYKRDLIIENKAKRGTFTNEDQMEVKEYNQAELLNLVRLMDELRRRLGNVGLFPARWDGPGAVAVALLKREQVKNAMAISPDHVREAARYAYAGGRFEVIRYGDVEGKAYEYDINSAYPYALQFVPNLARGRWETLHGALPRSRYEFAIFEVTWSGKHHAHPNPFPVRGPQGNVFYPVSGSGWYWAPEVWAALEAGWELDIKRVYRFIEDDPQSKPFDFIPGMYRKRQALKKAGDGAHVGIKLGLNSLYGKTCQKVGYEIDESGTVVRVPPFHQLEWAGFTTSVCRSLVFSAAMQAPDKVIAFETDALFMAEPLALDIGNGLGQWEATEFESLCYTQSGFYFGTVADGKDIDKTRGIDRGSMTYGDVKALMANPVQTERIADAKLSRFVTAGLALQLNDWTRWRRWEQTPKSIKLYPTGKREHVGWSQCWECSNHMSLQDGWHMTVVPLDPGTVYKAHMYPIPWEPGSEEMDRLEEMTTMHRELMAVDYE